MMRLRTDQITFQLMAGASHGEEQVTYLLEAADDDSRPCREKFLAAAQRPAEFDPGRREHLYIVGKLKGAISAIDRIQATRVNCTDGRIEFQARYTQVLNYDLDPSPAVAYFCIPLKDVPESVRELRIHFSQYLDDSGTGKVDWTREKPLEHPVLTDVTATWASGNLTN